MAFNSLLSLILCSINASFFLLHDSALLDMIWHMHFPDTMQHAFRFHLGWVGVLSTNVSEICHYFPLLSARMLIGHGIKQAF
jgi:hypothetical protein